MIIAFSSDRHIIFIGLLFMLVAVYDEQSGMGIYTSAKRIPPWPFSGVRLWPQVITGNQFENDNSPDLVVIGKSLCAVLPEDVNSENHPVRK